MVKVKTLPWDHSEGIETEEDMALSLSIALEDDDPRLLLATLNDIAKAKARLDAGQTGVTSTKKKMSDIALDESTDIATVLKRVRELGLQLRAEVAVSHKP